MTADVGYLGSNTTDQSKPLPGRHYGYGYDNAGNRLWSDRTGVDANNDGLPDMRDNYTTNALNQYVSRENNTVPLSGTAAPDTTPAGGAGGVSVAIKGRTVAAGRQGRYWNDEITVPNTLNPWRGPVTIFSAMRGTSSSPDLYRMDSRMVEIAAVLQNYTYDADGNLTNDGLVDYTWDAENRLIRIETDSVALSYGFPHRLIEFKYDYMGRRVQKRVVDVDQNVELYCRRYLYDGWNLIAEYLAPGGTTLGSLVRSYTWGLDIALSMTNAGGVGALLQIADHPTGKTYVPTYDGNGNIVSLLNADSGALAAVYEYSPFGEPLRAQTYDATIADNPWRFSTKWTDLETGLLYYGHRYYDPHNGRFINRDPIEEQGGLNLYGFCLNNAINRWDVLGNNPRTEDDLRVPNINPNLYVPGVNNVWWGSPQEAAASCLSDRDLLAVIEGPDPSMYDDTSNPVDATIGFWNDNGGTDKTGQTTQNSTSDDGSSPTAENFTNNVPTANATGSSGGSNASTDDSGSSKGSGPTNSSSNGGASDLTFNVNLDSSAAATTGATTSSSSLTFDSKIPDLDLTLPTATSSTAAAASTDPNNAVGFGPNDGGSAAAYLRVFAPGQVATAASVQAADGKTLFGWLDQKLFGVSDAQKQYYAGQANAQNIANANTVLLNIMNPAAGRDMATMQLLTGVAQFGTTLYTAPLFSVPGQCFPAGTIVSTPKGDVKIEDIKAGDVVYAFDFESGSVVESHVEELLHNYTFNWMNVTVAGETIRATRGHRFWVESEKRWVEAVDLKEGMKLRMNDGTVAAITAVELTPLNDSATTYNLEVEKHHTYFVGHHHVLVHNGPDFIVTPGGVAFPVPTGATGPTPTRSSGFMFTGGSGGANLSSSVTGVRFMDRGPTVTYMNSSMQAVNPGTGQTLAKTDPLWHINPANPPCW